MILFAFKNMPTMSYYTMWSRMASNLRYLGFSCLSLLNAHITGMYHCHLIFFPDHIAGTNL